MRMSMPANGGFREKVTVHKESRYFNQDSVLKEENPMFKTMSKNLLVLALFILLFLTSCASRPAVLELFVNPA